MHAQQCGNRPTREVEILKGREKSKVQGDAQSQKRAPRLRGCALQNERDRKIRQRQYPQEQDVPSVPASVEVIARHEQHDPPRLAVLSNGIEYRRHDGHEYPELIRLQRQRTAYADESPQTAKDLHEHCGAKLPACRSIRSSRPVGASLLPSARATSRPSSALNRSLPRSFR